MLPQVQPSHQQHHIEPECEVGQRQRIGLRATVRPLVSWAVHIRTAIACVVQLDHPLQRDHRAPGQRHRLMQRPMTLRTFMLEWSIPASNHLWIASRVVHRLSPWVNLTERFPSVYHTLSHAFFAPTEKKAKEEDRTIVFVDEAGFYLLPMAVRTYAPVGQTPILKVPLTRDHLSAIGGLTM